MNIVKIKNPKKSSTKKQRISKLVDYMLSPTSKKNKNEKCVFSVDHGFFCGDVESKKKEMIELSNLVRKSSDTVDHYVLSFQEGEHPTEKQFREMVELFLVNMGWKDHQAFAALHVDTDNVHVHLAVNRVHPVTEKVVRIGKDIERVHQTIAVIENKQGWKSQENSRYSVLENGEVAKNRSGYAVVKQPGQKQQEMEILTGEKSAQRIGQERATDILREATSWPDLHEKMQKEGFRYEKFGSGAKIYIGEIAIKASAVENGSFGSMQKRLGIFQPFEKQAAIFYHNSPPVVIGKKVEDKPPVAINISESKVILESATSWAELHRMMGEKGLRFEKTGSGSTVFLGNQGLKSSEISRKGSFQQLIKRLGEYKQKEDHGKFFTHAPEPDFGRFGKNAGHSLQNLSERNLAYASNGRSAGILQIDARISGSKLENVRRQSQPALIKNERQYIREPLRANTEGWEAYSKARQSHKQIRKAAIEWAKKESSDDMKTLLASHKSSRENLYKNLSGSGSGSPFRTAFKSILAAQHACEKLDLIHGRKAQKDFVMTEYPAEFPPIEQWQKNRGRGDLARQWRANKQDVQDIIGDADASPQRRDLRDFSHRVDGDAVAYYKHDDGGSSGRQVGFVDFGKKISIHNWRDEETTLAALQLASQKFEKFAVTGGDEYKRMCVKLAAEHGLRITNPELQEALAEEKMRVSQLRQAAVKTKEFQDFEKYHAAVGADRYRITARKEVPGAKDKLFLIGDGGARLKGVMPDRVAMKIGEMIHLAKQGQKIELGPLSKNTHHFVIKGVTDESLKRLHAHGYNPSVIVKTGPGVHTAIINMKKLFEYDEKHSAIHGEKIGAALSKLYGSEEHGISHPAPGFLQAEIIKAVKTECTKIVELARKVIEDIDDRRAGKAPVAAKPVAELEVLSAADTPSSRMLTRQPPPKMPKPTF